MSTDFERPIPKVNPRPRVVKTLGILNIVFAVLSSLCIGWSTMFLYALSTAPKPEAVAKVEVKTSQAPGPGVPMTASFNPFTAMQDRNFIRFSVVENGLSMVINGFMFATGLGLLNLKRWAARGWGYVAWVRIILIVLMWGYFIVGVAPGLSETMAKEMAAQFANQGAAPGRAPSVALLTQVYSITNLITALMAILITSIYPAISIWLLSRPGVKAALVDKNSALGA